MPTLQEQLQAAVVQTTTDSGLLHTIVHGDASTTVTTEGGPVKSVAKVISENQALLTTSLSTLTAMRDQAVASAAAAEDSKVAAAASETASAGSASVAEDAAAEALASKNAAADSENHTADLEAAAADSKTAAGLSEVNAADSEVAAHLSETNAAASELAAQGYANSAAIDAVSANASKLDAQAAAALAASSAAGQLFSQVIDITFADSPFTVPNDANGHLFRVDTAGGAVQINLPTLADLAADFRLGVAKASGDVNTVAVNRTGTDTINGLTSRTLAAQYNIDTFIGDKDNEVWFASGGGLGAVNITVQRFSGDGTQTDFSLSGTPGSENNTNIYISGVYQQKDTYSLSGNTLAFGEAPPTGTDNVEVVFGAQAPIGVPADDTVDTIQIKDGAVTPAKMQAISVTKRLLGRNSAGAGSPEEVSLNQLLDWVGGTAQGDILYRSNTGWERLAAGTNGQFLKTQGAGANPVWENVVAGTLTQGYVRNLKVEDNPSWNTAVNITAAEVVLTDGNGKTCKITNLSMVNGSPGSGQINPTGARYVFGGAGDGSFGGGTWVYGYLISDGAGHYGFVWSSSYSKPNISTIVANGYTEYTGWTFYKLLTAQYIKPAGDNLPMYQRDNVIQWKQWVVIANGATGNLSTPTWTAVGILGVGYAAPPDAVTFMGTLYSNTGGTNCMVAPNAGFGAFGSTSNGPPVGVNTPSGNGGTYVPFEFVLESSNIYWAAQGGSDRLISRGFTLNL